MNQHQIQRDMSNTAYWDTYHLELVNTLSVRNLGQNQGGILCKMGSLGR